MIEEPHEASSSSNILGATQPISIANKKPPKIRRIPPKIASKFPKVFKLKAEGIPIIKMLNVDTRTAFFLGHPKWSIKEETGTSRRETDEVIAAI